MKKSFTSLFLAILILFSVQCFPVCAADDFVDVKISSQFCNRIIFDVSCYSNNHPIWLDFGDGTGVNLNCGRGLIRHNYDNPGEPADDYIVSIITYDSKTYQAYATKEIFVSIPKARACNSIYPVKAKGKTVTIKVYCFPGLTSLNWGDGTSVSINLKNNDKTFTRTFSHTYTTPTNIQKSYNITLQSTFLPTTEANDDNKSSAIFTYFGSKESTIVVNMTYPGAWYTS